jgi:O-methyltransferase
MKTNHLAETYINHLKSSLLNKIYIESEAKLLHVFSAILNDTKLEFNDFFDKKNPKIKSYLPLLNQIKETGDTITLKRVTEDGKHEPVGSLRNITEIAHTMIGEKRLDNIKFCIETVLKENVSGDFIETGIWRGGACIFMRGILKAYDVSDRIVWCADSFDGVPEPSWPQDSNFNISKSVLPVLAVPLEEVQELFQRYGLLDEQVKFLEGWFKDTLGEAPINKISILRLDGDLYESTMDALTPLYEKVQSGGFIIVDDYESCPPCKAAIVDFRQQNNIVASLEVIDGHSVYWRKP